jgi:hypothetical protein
MHHPSSSISSYPYGAPPSPDGHARGQIFHNRSLVVNNPGKYHQSFTTSSVPEQVELSSDENSNPSPRGVAKYGRGAKAWISEDALRRKLERRKQFANNSQTAEKKVVIQQRRSTKSGTSSPSVGYITIDEISFQVTNGGSKLLRTTGRPTAQCVGTGHAQISTDTSTLSKATPKEATVSGVTFRRSKNGNLVRVAVTHQGFVFKK